MAKRILIDKVKLLDKLTYMGYMDEEKSEIEDVVNALSGITEQEIVKPYLMELINKLEPIKECEFQIYGKESWNFVGKCQDKILDMIDDFLSEQGGR